VVPDCGPTCGWQHQDGQLFYRKVLLISQILIGSNEYIELFFCGTQEIPVIQIRPSHLERSNDRMIAKGLPQGDRSTLIEEDSQRVRFSIGKGSGLDQTVFSVF